MLTPRFHDAYHLAATVHATQTRKGTTTPYLAHLLGVTAIALEHGATEDQAIAALLHDAVEDGDDPTLPTQIRENFGPTVARIVLGCSDSEGGEKAPWVLRKRRYLAHLPEADPDVLLVSASDKLHNLRSILTDLRNPALGAAVFDRFKAGRVGTLWYYAALIATYRASNQLPAALVADLEAALAELERAAGGLVTAFPAMPAGLPDAAWEGSQSEDDRRELAALRQAVS